MAPNVEITLKRPLPALAGAVARMDVDEHTRGAIPQLVPMMPSDADIAAAGGRAAVEGRLGFAESFFFLLSDVPAAREKAAALRFKVTFISVTRPPRAWADGVPLFQFTPDVPQRDIFVPTPSTAPFSHLMSSALLLHRPALVFAARPAAAKPLWLAP